MKLNNHQQAPDFTVKDIYGKTIRLADLKGKKIHLGFFRNVNCPFCNLRIHEIAKVSQKFESKGLQMVYFFESKPDVIKRSTFHQGVSPIPLVGDPEKKIYTLYGVENSVRKALNTFFTSGAVGDFKTGKALNLPTDKESSLTLIPADFLIDENLRIVKAYYGNHLNDHIALDDIKTFAGI